MGTFGKYIKARRLESKIGLRKMARYLEVAPSYLLDIENGRRNPPRAEVIEKIADKLVIEVEFLYDLAGKTANTIPPDLPIKIIAQKELIRLIRAASKKLSPDKILKLTTLLEQDNFDIS